MLSLLKKYWAIALALAGLLAVGYVGYGCGRRSQDAAIAELTTKLATSEQTVEIEKGLYAKKAAEVEGLNDLITKIGAENTALAETVKKGQMDVIALNALVLKWKKAYEAEVNAHQTEEPPVVPGDPPRKRVDFSGRVGPISVVGHTLTDPPTAFLKWEQTDPLRITVAVTRNRNGTYSTLVNTSNDEIAVDIQSAVVDLSSLRPRWYQRIWVDAGVGLLMGQGANLGLSYRFDRFALGVSCSVWKDGKACGLTAGYRIFR